MKKYLISFITLNLAILVLFINGCTSEPSSSSSVKTAKPISHRDVLPMPGEASRSSDVLPLPGASKKGDLVSSFMKTMNQSPLDTFKTSQDQPLYTPLPSSWIKTLEKLKKTPSLKVKVIAWFYGISAYARHKPLRMGSLTIKILGPVSKAKTGIKNILNKVRLPQVPKVITSNHQGQSKKMKWTLKSDQVSQGNQTVSTWTIEWQDQIPTPPSPLPNCRRIHALPPFTGFESWTHFGFKSGSIKRLMAYSVDQKQNQAEWFFTILYRNGEKRDLGIGQWRDRVEQKGGRLVKQKNMRLLWQWKSPKSALKELEWWSETDPETMGCDLVSPLLGMRWLRTSSSP